MAGEHQSDDSDTDETEDICRIPPLFYLVNPGVAARCYSPLLILLTAQVASKAFVTLYDLRQILGQPLSMVLSTS